MQSQDCFIKIKLNFNIQTLAREIDEQKSRLDWQDNQVSGEEFASIDDGRYHKGEHGTKWCYLKVSNSLINDIEKNLNLTIFKDVFYLWDYGKVRNLPVHIDTLEINHGQKVAACIPIKGSFLINFYSDFEKTETLASCRYGPGDLMVLNNLKYHHDGEVLNDTRLSFHFFINEDFDTVKNKIANSKK